MGGHGGARGGYPAIGRKDSKARTRRNIDVTALYIFRRDRQRGLLLQDLEPHVGADRRGYPNLCRFGRCASLARGQRQYQQRCQRDADKDTLEGQALRDLLLRGIARLDQGLADALFRCALAMNGVLQLLVSYFTCADQQIPSRFFLCAVKSLSSSTLRPPALTGSHLPNHDPDHGACCISGRVLRS